MFNLLLLHLHKLANVWKQVKCGGTSCFIISNHIIYRSEIVLAENYSIFHHEDAVIFRYSLPDFSFMGGNK